MFVTVVIQRIVFVMMIGVIVRMVVVGMVMLVSVVMMMVFLRMIMVVSVIMLVLAGHLETAGGDPQGNRANGDEDQQGNGSPDHR